MLHNSTEKYGFISQKLHWLSAITIFFLFGLGFWMVELTYYSEWYQTAPHWHESIGILLFFLTSFRLIWRAVSVQPLSEKNHDKITRMAAKLTHLMIYLLLFLIFFSGYLIPTADERAIQVFTWFTVPSLGELFAQQEDLAGLVHEYSAYFLITLAIVHAAAALKHHYIDKDTTLTRML